MSKFFKSKIFVISQTIFYSFVSFKNIFNFYIEISIFMHGNLYTYKVNYTISYLHLKNIENRWWQFFFLMKCTTLLNLNIYVWARTHKRVYSFVLLYNNEEYFMWLTYYKSVRAKIIWGTKVSYSIRNIVKAYAWL